MYWLRQYVTQDLSTGAALPKNTTVPSAVAIGAGLHNQYTGPPQPARQPLVYSGQKWVNPTQTLPVMTGGAPPAQKVPPPSNLRHAVPGPGPAGGTEPPPVAGSTRTAHPAVYVPPSEPSPVAPPGPATVPIPVPGGGPGVPGHGSVSRIGYPGTYLAPAPRPGQGQYAPPTPDGLTAPIVSAVSGGMVDLAGDNVYLPGMNAPGTTVSTTANPSIQDTTLTPCQGVPGVCLAS